MSGVYAKAIRDDPYCNLLKMRTCLEQAPNTQRGNERVQDLLSAATGG